MKHADNRKQNLYSLPKKSGTKTTSILNTSNTTYAGPINCQTSNISDTISNSIPMLNGVKGVFSHQCCFVYIHIYTYIYRWATLLLRAGCYIGTQFYGGFGYADDLTHLPQDKTAADHIFICILWMKICVFWLRFHWSLFLRVQLIIIQHWFR